MLQPEVAQYIVKEHGKFVRHLVVAAKAEFAGTPKATEANQLAVWKFLYRLCEKRGLNTVDANKSLSAALPLVFIPGHFDRDMLVTMNSDDVAHALRERQDVFKKESALLKLLDNPLQGWAWKNWADSILFGDQATGLFFAK